MVNRVVGTPGPKDFTVKVSLGPFVGFECFDDLLNVLCLVFVGDQHRVGCLYDHKVLGADKGNEAMVGMYIAVVSVV